MNLIVYSYSLTSVYINVLPRFQARVLLATLTANREFSVCTTCDVPFLDDRPYTIEVPSLDDQPHVLELSSLQAVGCDEISKKTQKISLAAR